jgi:hypothetical protein
MPTQEILQTRQGTPATSNVEPLLDQNKTPISNMNLEGMGGAGGVASTQGPGAAWTYQNYLQNSTNAINSLYDQRTNAALGALEEAYNLNLSNATAARDKLPGQYQTQANDMAAQYERNRRNLNEQAAANGINTGAGSQQRLALNNVWNQNYGRLRTAQAGAIAEANRDINNLTSTYNTKRATTIADIEAQRQAAILEAQEQQYNRDLQQAQLRASYGDFSGFSALGYDDTTIKNMRQVWIAQNPLLAYNTGAINANQYHKMTGKYAPGYEPDYGGYGGGGGGGDKDDDTTDKSDSDVPQSSYGGGNGGGYTPGGSTSSTGNTRGTLWPIVQRSNYVNSNLFNGIR